MKLCKDCKWCVTPGEFAKCGNPKTMIVEQMLTGYPGKSGMHYCSTARMFGWLGAFVTRNCGKHARFFEPAR